MIRQRWSRIPLRIQPIFWLMALFIGWLNSGTILGTVIWAGVILFSLLVHEYGHALTAVACGQRATIELMLFGGATRHSGGQLRRWQEFLIVFNGPLASVLLAGIAYLLLHYPAGASDSSFVTYILKAFFGINLFWTAVNLLPIHPLDGGQLLSITLQGLFGSRGLRAALLFSTVCGAVITLLCLAAQAILAGSLFLLLTFESYRSWRYSQEMSDSDHNKAYVDQLKQAEEKLQSGDSSGAEQLFKQIVTTTQGGVVHRATLERLAEIYLSQGRYQAAYTLLKPYASRLSEKALALFAKAAYHCSDWQSASTAATTAYQHQPSPALAVLNARCQARLNQPAPAVGWLQCAKRDGVTGLAALLQHPDFDSVRQSDPFRSLIVEQAL